jgi:hypothetical protein
MKSMTALNVPDEVLDFDADRCTGEVFRAACGISRDAAMYGSGNSFESDKRKLYI